MTRHQIRNQITESTPVVLRWGGLAAIVAGVWFAAMQWAGVRSELAEVRKALARVEKHVDGDCTMVEMRDFARELQAANPAMKVPKPVLVHGTNDGS